MKVEWVHFPLHPETPAEGQSLEELFKGRGVDRTAMHAQMKARMDAEGLPYGERTMTYNSRLAQELGKWADTQPGGGDAFHDAMKAKRITMTAGDGTPLPAGAKAVTTPTGDRYCYFPLERSEGLRIMVFQRAGKGAIAHRDGAHP